MPIPISPSISLSPSTFSSVGTQITATVSVMNRPAYHGLPSISGLTTITPKIVCSRTPSGVLPFHLQVSGCETTHNGSNPSNAWMDLSYEWDFGDSSGTETFTDHWNGKTVNANNEQQGPEAAYIYRTAGTYTITLTVKGKDENGTLVSASTTSLLTVGLYYIHTGGATGGTYTLTVNGETTAAIAYNAIPSQIVSALHALASLDSTNCRTGLFGLIELNGNLSGQTNTFTITSSLTGTVSTPAIRTEITSATASSVSVSSIASAGLTEQYFDSNYDGSNGVANGTSSRPYTTFSSLETFLEAGGNRVAWIKRGSTFTMNSRIKFDLDSQETIRVLAYGTGASPVLTQSTTTSNFNWELTYGSSGTPNITMGDTVFSGIDIATTAEVKSFFFVASGNGTVDYPYARVKDVVIDQCNWSTTVTSPTESGFMQSSHWRTPVYETCRGGTTSTATLASTASSTTNIYVGRTIGVVIDGVIEYSTITAYNGTTKVADVSPSFSASPDSNDAYTIYLPSAGCQVHSVHFWKCAIDGGGSSQVALIQSQMGAWGSFVGDSLEGGTGNLTFDHHMYIFTTGHNLLRYVVFGSGYKNLCINGNAHAYGGAMQYSLFDGCDFTGTKNGIDMSNTLNAWSNHPDDGYFDDAVVQFCKLHSGGVSATEKNGVISYNLKEATLRYCDWWDNEQSHISIANTTDYPWQPKLYVYNNRFYGGHVQVRGSQVHYYHDNVHHSNLNDAGVTAYCLKFYNTSYSQIANWDADGNIWYNDQTTNPFYDANTSTAFSLATWQAAGNDATGSVSNPQFHDPSNGVFTKAPTVAVTWPTAMTSKEYSLDGVSWSSYTNSAELSIGTSLSTYTLVYFRASSDAHNGSRDIAVSTDATSLDVAVESDSAALVGSGLYNYVAISVGSNVLLLAVSA